MLTSQGKGMLAEKKIEWDAYAKAVSRVMDGGVGYAFQRVKSRWFSKRMFESP